MASQFISNSTVTYDVGADGTTNVTHDISLQNTTSNYYATSYTLSLTGISPINPKAYENNQALPVDVSINADQTSLQVNFPDAVVGQGSKREFLITFDDKSLVKKTGEIWEITTPKLADASSFDFYSSILKIPHSFGKLAYISPDPSFREESAGKTIFSFNKDASLKSTISAAFGQFQVFSFNLTYHLENPLSEDASIDLALPPDTNYQKMNYSKIAPLPSKISVDDDGNWLATYDLKTHEKVDIKVSGAVQLFASPLSTPQNNPRPEDLAPTDLWQSNNSAIKSLAQKLKTADAIYNYVTSTLSYDYAKVSPNVQRIGAVAALQNPKSAICTEFTDLFIALARAARIPAREMEGFAYTQNPQIEPLSLVADVLHAWPEYWDSQKQIWVPVDPTWGSTSGIDYFTKLDLRHFAFVVHGKDPKRPYPAGSYKLGPNPQKDIEVTFGNLPVNRVSSLTLENTILSQVPFSNEIIDTKVRNTGPVALYNSNLQILFDNKSSQGNQKIAVIPPFGYYETTVNVPYSFLGQKTPNKVEFLVDNSVKSEVTTYKTYLTISNLLIVTLLVFFAVVLIYLKFKDAKTLLAQTSKKHPS